jgi:hypothetical protein
VEMGRTKVDTDTRLCPASNSPAGAGRDSNRNARVGDSFKAATPLRGDSDEA